MSHPRGRGRKFRVHRGHTKPIKKDPPKMGEHVNKLQPRIDYSGLPRDDVGFGSSAGALSPDLLLPLTPPEAVESEEPVATGVRAKTVKGRLPKVGMKDSDAIDEVDSDADEAAGDPKKVKGKRGSAAARVRKGKKASEDEGEDAPSADDTPTVSEKLAAAASAYASMGPSGLTTVGLTAAAPGSMSPGSLSPSSMSPGSMQSSSMQSMAAAPPPIPGLTEIPKSLLSSGALQIPRVLRMSLTELLEECKKENVTELANTQKNYVAGVVIRARLQKHGFMLTDGCLEVLPEGFGFLRPSFNDYLPNPDDIFVSQNLIRRYGLKTGHMIAGAVRPPRDNEKYLALARIDAVNDEDPNLAATKTPFEELTPLYPDQRLTLETDAENLETRIIDLISPVGKGQRGLIVSPPRAGKTIILQKIASAISKNNPECHLLVLLVDERPEEVTDMERTVNGEVIASTFDEPASRHVQVAHMVIQKAKRLVEYGKDVVILLDSITRLARAHNIESPGSSKILSGGIDASALQKPKQFFGAARNIEKGGSLTILGTALIDTGSRMDEVIFEEFKGTGNMELVLDRRLADRRVFPALDINMSGTRREDLLMEEEEMKRVWILRRFMNDIVDPVEAMDLLLEKMRKAKTNAEFLLSVNTDK